MEECTIHKTMNIVGKRWSLPVLLELHKGKKEKRFVELKKSMEGITPKMLTARLKELEREGLVRKKKDSSTMPIKCEYSLTKSGEELVSSVQEIKKWALKWKFKNQECKQNLCKNCEL